MTTMLVDRGGLLRHVDTNYELWQLELDRLELDVMRAERALATDGLVKTDHWEQPCVPGPLPLDLRERATEIHARQQELLATLMERLCVNQRHQAVTESVSRVSTRNQLPVYLDINA